MIYYVDIDGTICQNTQGKYDQARHHEIKMWKPHFDFYICDKSIHSETFFKFINQGEKE